jgi:predicted dehydrogenase
MDRIRVLVVGCGHMGSSHAFAYQHLNDFEIVGVVSRGLHTRSQLSDQLGGVPQFDCFETALDASHPDAVNISTYPDTHADYCLKALHAGCHVFVEKPLAVSIEQAREVVDAAREADRKVVVGYILRVHPAWQRFISIAKTLGKPLVMRMNLNQQSSGQAWQIHKNLMQSMSPIVDCGVHYVDVMCQMTESVPLRVSAMGARLSDDLPVGMYNYGQLQVVFADASIGWYEAGWGPMISENAFFVKDVVGPGGCVSMITPQDVGSSANITKHTQTNQLRVHSATMNEVGFFSQSDQILDMSNEPDHIGLCKLEQEYFLKAIREDLDLTIHLQQAVNSLRIVLAADQSVRTGQVVNLSEYS